MTHMTTPFKTRTDHRKLMKPAKLHLLAILGAALLAVLPPAARGQANNNPPTQLTYQGFLTDLNGVPLGNTSPTNKSVTFKIYDAETGGNVVWSSIQVVTVDKGHFSVLLGQGSAGPEGASKFSSDLTGIFTGSPTSTGVSDRYMELTVDSTPLLPRLRFMAAPYAMLARKAMSVDASVSTLATSGRVTLVDHLVFNSANGVINWGSGALYFRKNTIQGDPLGGHTDVMTITSDGKVGIGTAFPQKKLDVNGAMQVFGNLDVIGPGRFKGDGSEITALNAANITSGTLDQARIGNLAATKITSGTFDAARIPNLDATKITTGTLSSDRLPATITGATTFSGTKLRVDNAFSMGGASDFAIDASGLVGGRMVVKVDGKVGIGTSDPKARLHVTAPTIFANDFYASGNQTSQGVFLGTDAGEFNLGGANGTGGDNTTIKYDYIAGLFDGILIAKQRVYVGNSLTTSSDRRAKNILGQSSSAADLKLLEQLRVTDFTWIDRRQDNHRAHKLLIAQQVAEVFPQAVSVAPTPQTIPSVYEKGREVRFDRSAGRLHITVSKPHGFVVGDKIDLFARTQKLEGVKVLAVGSLYQFAVAASEPVEDVFVYGKQVNDFLTVDYDAVAMLNVSATQELARRNEKLETENESLKRRVIDLEARERQVVAMQKRVDELEGLERQMADLQKLVRQVAERQNLSPRAALSDGGAVAVLPASAR